MPITITRKLSYETARLALYATSVIPSGGNTDSEHESISGLTNPRSCIGTPEERIGILTFGPAVGFVLGCKETSP